MEWLTELEVVSTLRDLGVLLIAFVLALPIGWDREASRRRVGLRTFPLVAMASAGYVLLAHSVLSDDPQSLARILQGLITGVGFLGGGAIVKQGTDVHGLSTAASIWATAVLGAAVGCGRFEIALLLSLVTMLTLRGLRPIKEKAEGKNHDRA